MMKQLYRLDDEAKAFYKKVFALVVPMALQNLINVGVTAADVMMLGKVGETVLSAASLAGQVQFIMMLIYFGISSGASVLIAQYWGKRDIAAIEKILGMAIRISAMVGIFFFVVTLALPEQIMRIFTNEEPVIAEGVKYLRIVAFSYVTSAFSAVYLNVIRGVERVMVSTVVYAISLVTNVILNYIFIFGNFGAPRLEIRGAAFGTLAARMVELTIVLVYAYVINREVRFSVKNVFARDKLLFHDFLKYAMPVILNELMWGAGYSANAAIIGHLGSSVVAANSVAQVTRQLATVVSFGIAGAAAIMLGKAIGEGNEQQADNYAGRFVRLTLVTGAAGAVVILCLMPVIINIMGFQAQTAFYVRVLLSMMSYYVMAQAMNSLWVVGIFRSGGDTRFGLILDVTSMWCCSILLGAVAAFVLRLSIPVVCFILLSDELIKIPFCLKRYRGKKWLKNVTR